MHSALHEFNYIHETPSFEGSNFRFRPALQRRIVTASKRTISLSNTSPPSACCAQCPCRPPRQSHRRLQQLNMSRARSVIDDHCSLGYITDHCQIQGIPPGLSPGCDYGKYAKTSVFTGCKPKAAKLHDINLQKIKKLKCRYLAS